MLLTTHNKHIYTRYNKLQEDIDAYVDMLTRGSCRSVEGVLCLPKEQWDIFNKFRGTPRSLSEPVLTYTYFLHIRAIGWPSYIEHESKGLYAVWYTTYLRNSGRR